MEAGTDRAGRSRKHERWHPSSPAHASGEWRERMILKRKAASGGSEHSRAGAGHHGKEVREDDRKKKMGYFGP